MNLCQWRSKLTLLGVILTLAVSGVSGEQTTVLMMATTTSTDNTGLLEYLAPLFKQQSGLELRWVATGTGNALKLGRNCDVDILMVHAPAQEEEFVKDGYGVKRHEFMYNDFVLIGPFSDPAQIKSMPVDSAFMAIMRSKSTFVSRGDNSGTHVLEQQIWLSVNRGVPEKHTWYLEAGQGMLACIRIAEQHKGYTLSDRGTFIKYESDSKGNPQLVVLVEGDPSLKNRYGVIAVNPQKCPTAKISAAQAFVAWITGAQGQAAIVAFKLSGKQLFFPCAK